LALDSVCRWARVPAGGLGLGLGVGLGVGVVGILEETTPTEDARKRMSKPLKTRRA
jgi:hypothetical protein